ncbi:hypothetical protein DV707_10730 [Halobellus limi]|uniref:Phage portal protein n=1 Tax=Halobellus limi TaxID=699433 RepID=A0A4D6H492_9EURY|nr:hypothetical protein [Halobellus limi]QCC48096.1 hypothetical protein DV707_10730 [Halobellus limi]
MVVSDDAKRRADFMLESPKAVVVRGQAAGGKPRPSEAPESQIDEFRAIRRTDPHVAEIINLIVDYIVGTGFNVAPANIPYTDEGQTPEEVADFKRLIEVSGFEGVLPEWVDVALTDGTAFLAVVVEDDVFKPKVLPTKAMSIQRDKFGNITGYEMDNPDAADPIEFGPFDLAILRFFPDVNSPWGHSLIEFIQEPVDMLRDMEIDMARFVATKAYPPIHFKCGTEDRPWHPDEITNWLNELRDIEPESMLATGHDVEHDVVGTTSTQSSAGMMNLEPVFKHLLQRIHAGMGVPPFLTGMDTDINRNTSVAVMPKFDRRIQRFRRILRHVIRYQVFVSILGHPTPEDYVEIPPDFEFGQHSSEEERLEAEMAIQLVNNGLLTREAAAERIGIDPETELPQEDELAEHIRIINELAGKGDNIQNPNGGSPSGTGGGTESGGRSVKGRQNPEKDTSGARVARRVMLHKNERRWKGR